MNQIFHYVSERGIYPVGNYFPASGKGAGEENRRHRAIINLRLRVSRNIGKYPFPTALARRPSFFYKTSEEIWERVSEFLSKESVFRRVGEGCYKFYLPQLKKRERIFLVERRVISPDMIKSVIPSGVVFSKDEKYIAMINEEDHLRIGVNDTRCPMDEWLTDALFSLVERMDKIFSFARSEEYGYLTSCPSNLGGGLRLSAIFHLGGAVLSREIDGILETAEKNGYYVRGYYGEKSRYYGDVFQISTIYSPDGKDALRKAFDFFLKIEESELKFRDKLLKDRRAEDIIWRAWGALTSARLMSFAEASSAISIVMVGKDIGIGLPPVKKEVLDRLLVECQPAHIEMISGATKPMSAFERDSLRAQYIRKTILQEQ